MSKVRKGFIEKFERNFQENRLLKHRDKILVGFSGGADSTALLLCLYHLRTKYKFHLLSAHINYHLRGEESDRDEQFVKQFCFSRNISILVDHYKTKSAKVNENNLREYRFHWFNSIVKSYNLSNIALGHNKEDQAETILHRMFRGSLLTGLGGIKPIRGNVVHPLLPFSRSEITEFLNQEGVNWREDSSNQGSDFTRNKLRNELFPWLSENIHPRVSDKISEAASYFREADEYLENSARVRLHHIVEKKDEEEIVVRIGELLKVKRFLRFYIYRLLFKEIKGNGLDFYQSNFIELEKSLNSKGNILIQLPDGGYLQKEYDRLRFFRNGLPEEEELEEAREIPSLRNRFVYDGWRISMKKLKKLPSGRGVFLDRNKVYLDYDKLEWPLVVRHRESGDSFIPFGMDKHKKLKDFFIDIKLPRWERTKALVFCDQEKIIWIGNERIDQRVAITQETSNILMMKIEKVRQRKLRRAERIKK